MDVKKKVHRSKISLKLRTKTKRGVVLFIARTGSASDFLEVKIFYNSFEKLKFRLRSY